MIPRIALAAIAAIGLSTSVLAEPVAYDFDKSHANITFTIDHLGFSTAHGRFNSFDGTLLIDEAAPEASSVKVEIATDSLATFFDQRDAHLKSADFFDVATFPTMSFASTAVEKTGDDTLKVAGDLTMLGVTKPVTLDVTVRKLAPHPFSGTPTVGFHATGTIKRSEWGMSKLPAVGDDVTIAIDIEAAVAK